MQILVTMKYDLKSSVLPNNSGGVKMPSGKPSTTKSDESDNIKFIIETEKKQKDKINEIISGVTPDESKLL